MTVRHASWAIWRWPLVLAVLTVFGLVSALIGQGGLWWALSWTALATPLIVLACAIVRYLVLTPPETDLPSR